jgi:hypothetical protein
MIYLDALFAWPETVGGWAALLLAVVTVIAIIGGVAINLLTRNINGTVYREVHGEVPQVVALCLREVNAKLDGIRINLAELSAEVGRVRVLESKIDNGLTHKVAEIDDKVKRIKERQIVLVAQIAEMHGWMESTHRYDGTDRRST